MQHIILFFLLIFTFLTEGCAKPAKIGDKDRKFELALVLFEDMPSHVKSLDAGTHPVRKDDRNKIKTIEWIKIVSSKEPPLKRKDKYKPIAKNECISKGQKIGLPENTPSKCSLRKQDTREIWYFTYSTKNLYSLTIIEFK